MGLNQFLELPDKFYLSLYASLSSPSCPSGSPSEPSLHECPPSPETDLKAHESYYFQHCLLTITQIVSKLHTLCTAPLPLTHLCPEQQVGVA